MTASWGSSISPLQDEKRSPGFQNKVPLFFWAVRNTNTRQPKFILRHEKKAVNLNHRQYQRNDEFLKSGSLQTSAEYDRRIKYEMVETSWKPRTWQHENIIIFYSSVRFETRSKHRYEPLSQLQTWTQNISRTAIGSEHRSILCP